MNDLEIPFMLTYVYLDPDRWSAIHSIHNFPYMFFPLNHVKYIQTDKKTTLCFQSRSFQRSTDNRVWVSLD